MDDKQFSEIMGRLRSGDRASLDSLLIAGFTPLRAAVVQKMGSIPGLAGMEPEDVIQEVYVAACAKLAEAEFATFDDFLAWLRQIAENKLIDMHRAMLADKRDVRRQTPAWQAKSGTYVNLLERVDSPMTTPSRGAARSEALAVLMVRLLQLPEDYRQVIHWRMIDGLTVAEVAQRLGRSEGAVHMLFGRALKELRKLMGQPSDYLTQT